MNGGYSQGPGLKATFTFVCLRSPGLAPRSRYAYTNELLSNCRDLREIPCSKNKIPTTPGE